MSGFSTFPSLFPQAARSISLCLDASGNVVVGAFAQASAASGSGSAIGPSLLSYSVAASAWSLGPQLSTNQFNYLLSSSGTVLCGDDGQPLLSSFVNLQGIGPIVGVQAGWALDPLAGLLPWGNGIATVTNTGPYISLVSGASGVYTFSTTGIWNQVGAFVAGSQMTGAIAAFASGATLYGLSASAVWIASLSSSGAATMTSAAMPAGFTPTCIGPATGSLLAVGGWTPMSLSSGAVAMAVAPGGSTLLTLPGAANSAVWILSGSPAAWQFFASTTGLPSYSSSIGVEFVPGGSQVLLSDAGSGFWAAFSYVGGQLGLLSSGSLTGQVAGVAADSSSSYALIATPGSSGYAALVASGAGWVASGALAAIGLPGACAPHLLSGQTWAVGWSSNSGSVGLLSFTPTTNSWNLSPFITGLGWSPASFSSDSSSSTLWLTASGGQEGMAFSNSPVGGLIAVGTWIAAAPSGAAQPPIVTRGQFVLPTTGPNGIALAGQSAPGIISPTNFISVPYAPTAIAGPLLDGSIAISSTGGVAFWEFEAPWRLAPHAIGLWAALSGSSIGPVQSLGQRQVPSAFTLDPSGNALLATRIGYLGSLSGAPASLVSQLPSGGFSDGIVASGMTILTTEIQGLLSGAVA